MTNDNHSFPELEVLIDDEITRHTWNWGGRGLLIYRDSKQILDIPTQFVSRDGLRIVDALNAAGIDSRIQSTDHGCQNRSVQIFDAMGRLVSDLKIS